MCLKTSVTEMRVGASKRRYGPELRPLLARLWELSDRLCGKLLVAVLPVLLAALDRHQAWQLPLAQRQALLALSPATADRLLRPIGQARGRQPVRPGRRPAPLAARVPIRTWGEWADVAPGAVQADLVLHCGESTAGFFLSTLVVVDVATGWTELEPVWGLAHQRVRSAIAPFLFTPPGGDRARPRHADPGARRARGHPSSTARSSGSWPRGFASPRR
jgi:hypothetical protein